MDQEEEAVEFSTEMALPASAAQVAQMLATEAYVHEKIQASGATSGSVEILGSPEGAVTITTRRRLPTSDVPASYRSLVGSSIEIREVDAWEPPDDTGARRGTLVLEVTGAPVRVTGTLELRPTSPSESVVRINGDIKASVPFVGKTIEKAIAANVERATDVERRVAADWLARH